MGEPEGTACRYEIDASDRIREVGGAWLAFARDNDAPGLTPDAVVGRPLWDFIAGEDARALYRAVLARVRAQDVPIILPFRCDSPLYQRWMRLVMTPGRGGDVRFDALLVRKLERLNLGILDQSAPRSAEELLMCSCCKRVEVASCWLEPEDAIVRLHALGAEPYPRLLQSVCGDCESLAASSASKAGH